MKAAIVFILAVVVYMAKSQTIQPDETKPISTTPPGLDSPRGRDPGVRPWGFYRRGRHPVIQYDDYYYDYFGMGRGCSCSPYRCRTRFAFRGRCRGRYQRPGFRCCYFGFRGEFGDYDFDFFD